MAFRLIIGAALVAAALGFSPGAVGMSEQHFDDQSFDEAGALKYSQAAIGGAIGDYAFTGSDGDSVRLTDFRGKPLVISLIYTSCYHTCPMITSNLIRAVESAQGTFGEDGFNVLTIGFDVAEDTPTRMRAFGSTHGIDLPNWQLLSAEQPTIDALAADLGFIYFPSPKGFDHLAQTSVIREDGTLFRHFYGADFGPPMLVEPLKSLIFGGETVFSLDGLVDRVRLFCTIYDPKSDRYHFDYSLFLAIIIGALSLTAVAVVLIREWRKSARRSIP